MLRRVIVLLCLVVPSVALAWNAAGHMTQAALAWRVLTPSEQAWVDSILRGHPQAARWDADRVHSRSPVDPAAYRFLRASAWPDEIKAAEHLPDRSSWHFARYPLEGPVSQVEADPGASHNLLAGLAENEATVSDARASPKDRAVALAFVIHLLGDLHQPLHCANVISRVHKAPAGDRSGLDTFIRLQHKASLREVFKGKVSLRDYWKGKLPVHDFWDGLFGKSHEPADAMAAATKIAEGGTVGADPGDDETATALASRLLAQTVAYPAGAWIGKADDIHVDDAYVQTARSTADKEIASSGRQLVAVLRRMMKPSEAAPARPAVAARPPQVETADVPVVSAAKEVKEDRLLIKVIVGVILLASALWLGLALVVRQRQ